MGDKKNAPEQETGELQSIVKKQETIFTQNVDKPIVEAKPSAIEMEAIIEEEIIPEETQEVIPEEVVPPAPSFVDCYYELTTVNGKGEEVLIYTKVPPVIDTNKISLSSVFFKHDFIEIVLKKKKVQVACRGKELESLELDISTSILLKAIQPQDWMIRGFEETKVLFDQAVLHAYRLVNEEIASAPTPAAKPKQSQQSNEKWEDINRIKQPPRVNLTDQGNLVPDRPEGTFINY